MKLKPQAKKPSKPAKPILPVIPSSRFSLTRERYQSTPELIQEVTELFKDQRFMRLMDYVKNHAPQTATSPLSAERLLGRVEGYQLAVALIEEITTFSTKKPEDAEATWEPQNNEQQEPQ